MLLLIVHVSAVLNRPGKTQKVIIISVIIIIIRRRHRTLLLFYDITMTHLSLLRQL